MDRRIVATLALTLLLAGSGVGAAAGLPALQTGDVETDAVVMDAAVEPDGDAEWTIEYRVELDDENTTEAFESLQQDIEANSSDYRSQFGSRMARTVGAAENATGREMAVENVSVEATTSPLSGEYGVVRYRFEWVGFAEAADDRLAVGDALAGIFLDADTQLRVSWPEGYVVDVVDPEPDREGDRSVTWEGPREFDVGQPRLVLRPQNSVPPLGPVVGIVLFGAAGVTWYFRRRRDDREAGEPGATIDESGEATGDSAPASTPPTPPMGGSERTDERGVEAAGGSSTEMASGSSEEAAGDSGDEPAGGSSEATGGGTPEELLSPEERVLRLLEEHGGRMKQKTVTEELDWSAARTSQVVGSLRDAGEVESFRLGRENVLKFPDDDESE